MECTLCKNGSTYKGYVTVTLEKESTIVLIKNVPAEVCDTCGHYYLSNEMTTHVLDLAKEAHLKGTELEVINFQVA